MPETPSQTSSPQSKPSDNSSQNSSPQSPSGQSATRKPPAKSQGKGAPQLPALLGGSALIIFGLTRGSVFGKLLAAGGAALAYRGLQPGPSGEFVAGTRFRINTTVDEAYKLWRDLASAPKYMTHIASVRVIDEKHSEWTMLGPGDIKTSWISVLTDDQPGKRIAWQSTPESVLQTTGSVEFTPDPLGRGIFVGTKSTFNIPSGPLTRTALSVLGHNPDFIAREELRHFKSLLEAGEMPTVNGQPHGPRGLSGKASAAAFRENTNPPDAQAPGAPAGEPQTRQRAARQPELQPA